MSIITFWNDGKEQSGKTLTSVAVATRLSIERNSKVLLISTSLADPTIKNCFWGEEQSKNAALFNNIKASNVAVENGVEGLLKLVTSNKLTPSIITDYTKVIFKGRLEVLAGFSGSDLKTQEDNLEEFRKIESCYIDLIKTANQYYDVVIVDLEKMMSTKVKQEILRISNVNVYVMSQKMESINRYKKLKQQGEVGIKNSCVPVIGKYMANFKYNLKNIARYLGEKKEFDCVPLNFLYMGAAEETDVVDLFLKLRNIKDKTDENYIFMQCVLDLTNNIMKKLQEMQMRMR